MKEILYDKYPVIIFQQPDLDFPSIRLKEDFGIGKLSEVEIGNVLGVMIQCAITKLKIDDLIDIADTLVDYIHACEEERSATS